MRKPPRSENLLLEGPAGALEALLELPPTDEPRAVAVICHPHPVHGGTMQNKVTHTLARAFLAQQIAALRFNFRGVGDSAGVFDEGRGELQDALQAAAWMTRRYPDLALWWAGFSFGAAIAIRAAAATAANGLVSVAPAVARVSGDSGPQPTCPWLIIQGDEDELVDVDATIAWLNGLQPGPELQIFEQTEHFFHGQLVRLREAVEAFIRRIPAATK